MRLLVAASNELPEAACEALSGMLIRLSFSNSSKANFPLHADHQQDENDNPVPDALQVTDEEYERWQERDW